jgi:hypothetical protein
VTRVHKGGVTKKRDFAAMPVVGWREWVCLPDLGIEAIKVKVDTGARTSAIHAFDVSRETKDGKEFVHFKVHPLQRNQKKVVTCVAELVDERMVRSSSGHRCLRPVIRTRIEVGDHAWFIELTLSNRDEMGFRMLLGRQAVRDHLLVHPGKSYLLNPK